MKVGLTLTGRELARGGRSRRTYVLRMLVSGGSAVALAYACVMGAMTYSIKDIPEYMAEFMLGATLTFQFAVVLLLAPILAANLIAEEKEHDTLHLLLIADMKGFDIFLAKSISVFFQVEALLLSTLPMLSAAAFFGSISIPEVAGQVGLLTAWALASCAITMFCSTVASGGRQALMLALVLEAAILLLAVYIDVYTWGRWEWPIQLCLIPAVVGFSTAIKWSYPVSNAAYSLAVAVVFAFGTVSLLRLLAVEDRLRLQHREAARNPWGKGVLRMGRLGQLLAANAGGAEFTDSSRILRNLVGFMLLCVALVPVLGWIAVVMCLCFHIALSMSSTQTRGILADILMTPTEETKVATEVYSANVNRSMMFVPGLIASEYAAVITLWYGVVLDAAPHTRETLAVLSLGVCVVMPAILGLAKVFCLTSVACYASMRQGSALFEALFGGLLGTLIGAAVYGPVVMIPAAFLEVPSDGMIKLLALLFFVYAMAVYLGGGIVFRRMFRQGLWGRIPSRRFLPKSTPRRARHAPAKIVQAPAAPVESAWHIIEGEAGCRFAVEHGCVAVVVDAMRASATAAMMLDAGALELIVVQEVAHAHRAKRAYPKAVLYGERGGLPPEGFDGGNSPRDVGGASEHQVVFTTTTGALRMLQSWGAPAVLMGTTTNVSAVARAAASFGKDVVLIPAGLASDPEFDAQEDWAAAAAIAMAAGVEVKKGAERYAHWKTRIEDEGLDILFASAPHAGKLREVGLEDDIEFCAKEDLTAVVPRAVAQVQLPSMSRVANGEIWALRCVAYRK